MYIKNRMVAVIFRLSLLIICFIGIFIKLGLIDGQLKLYMFIYYTIQSNILVFITFLYITIQSIKDIKMYGVKGVSMPMPYFKGAVTMAIVVTGVVYHFLLRPIHFTMGNISHLDFIGNIILHYIIPFMVFFDWIIFDKKNSYRLFDPLIWLTIPLVYFVFVLIQSQFGSFIPNQNTPYPYPFIDIYTFGWLKVLKNIFFLTIAFTVLGYIIYFIDKLKFNYK